MRSEIAKAVVGQEAVVSGLVIALLCRGHVLLEGVPGVAKTLLVRTLAAALRLEFKRVQFTPDLMPGDVTGSLVYDARTAEFEFRPGPVFTNLLLADEINRTPPKTQAALLEAMEERQVSVDGEPRPLPDPFIVAATQNPIEYEGTYPLPEAQLDRFLLKLNVPLPPRDQEIAILTGTHRVSTRATCRRSSRWPAPPSWPRVAMRCVSVLVADEVLGYIVDMVGRDAALPVAAARCVTARGDGAAGDGPLLGLVVGTQLRHPRRRQGDGPSDAAAPDRVAAGGRTRGRHPRRRARRHPGVGPGTALVVLTGRAGLIALICVLPIGVSPWPAAAFVVLLALLLGRGRHRRRTGGEHPQSAVQPASVTPRPGSGEPRRGRAVRPEPGLAPFPRPDARRMGAVGPRGAAHPRGGYRRRDNGSASTPCCDRCGAAISESALVTARSVGPARAGRQAGLAPGALAGAGPATVPVPQAPAVAVGQAARARRR